MTVLKDKLGFTFSQGCKVVRAKGDGDLRICTVTRINEGKLYLDNSKQPMMYPSCLLIIEQDPLFKMVDRYVPNGECTEGNKCCCGGDTKEVREGCQNWRKE